MSRGGMIWGGTPVCIECGRMKTARDDPWMQHPVDYGWWCGCEPLRADAAFEESVLAWEEALPDVP